MWRFWRRQKPVLEPKLPDPVTLPEPTFTFPPEVADVADETLARYLRYAERSQPGWSPSQQRYLAVMLAEANLSERAAFRREISEYTR